MPATKSNPPNGGWSSRHRCSERQRRRAGLGNPFRIPPGRKAHKCGVRNGLSAECAIRDSAFLHLFGGRARRLENGPGVLTHIQDADDLNVCGQHAVTDERLLNQDTPQFRKHRRFDRVSPAWVFSDGDARRPDLACDSHLDAAAELAPEVAANVSPVFPGKFSESNPQSSRGSVKKSGGQSSSLLPTASRNFCSRAGVAA